MRTSGQSISLEVSSYLHSIYKFEHVDALDTFHISKHRNSSRKCFSRKAFSRAISAMKALVTPPQSVIPVIFIIECSLAPLRLFRQILTMWFQARCFVASHRQPSSMRR